MVFHAHWLTYFDDACTRFLDWLGFPPAIAFVRDFDLMIVKVGLEWQGPAGFDDHVAITVTPGRIGTKSLDLEYSATCHGEPACSGTVTYVSVIPGTHESVAIPDGLRAALASLLVD